MNRSVEQILKPFNEGKACIVLSGRDLNDLSVNDENRIQPLVEILRTEAFQANLILVQYSRSAGVTCDIDSLTDSERNQVLNTLNQIGLTNKKNGNSCGCDEEDEFTGIVRSLLRLGETTHNLKFRDGRPIRFMIIIDFSEHLMPHLQAGTHTKDQMTAIELATRISKSLSVRKSDNYIAFAEARQGMLDTIIYQNIPTVKIAQPDAEEKKEFLGALKSRYPKAIVEKNITEDVVVNLTCSTPNRSLESIYLGSEKTGSIITLKDVFKKKQEDIIALSEGTLDQVDYNRIKNQNLVGRTIEKPLKILTNLANGLKEGNPQTLRNLLLAGAPSTGKTMMANKAAANAGVPSFMLSSPKSSLVGESERKAKLMFSLLREQGGFGIADELELIFPMNRNSANNDSGVTQNLLGQFQSFLSDASLAGKCALIGTSNRPNAISEAMRQRWMVVPVLMPVKEDYPLILVSIAESLSPNIKLSANDPETIEIGETFFLAGAAPREIREAIIAALANKPGKLDINHLKYAALDIIPSVNSVSAIFADYCAIKFCRNNSFLPWWDNDTNKPDSTYPYPNYILEILDDNHLVEQQKLTKKINELAPYANV